jgi:AAA+ superfamily predicted ATPase
MKSEGLCLPATERSIERSIELRDSRQMAGIASPLENLSDELALLIRSKNVFISIETRDEARATKVVQAAALRLRTPLYDWSVTRGLRQIDPQGVPGRTLVDPKKPAAALEFIDEHTEQAIYVLRDLGPHCRDGYLLRLLRDLESIGPEWNACLILIDADPLPDEMRRWTVRFEVGWPSGDEIEDVVRSTFKKIRKESLRKITSKITKRDADQIVQTLRGLSLQDVERVISSAIFNNYELTPEDLPHIVEAKRQLLGNSGCLEAIAADFSPNDVGGLENLKSWLRIRRGGFASKAVAFGVEAPRGVLMLGVPGCGKSLCAKVVASDWQMPLLRLDPGVLYQKFIGESENQLRLALRQAEAMAPVVLWIDEIEKAFASASASSADGGLSQRMFGTMLSWMQDHRHPIFIVATANDISALPPELMRKGRFDEVFFVDLPDPAAREQILAIHLRRRGRDPEKFKLAELARAAADFSGAELEQAVRSAMFTAYAAGHSISDLHILTEIRRTKPLAVLTAERVASLRSWARDRCVPADQTNSTD